MMASPANEASRQAIQPPETAEGNTGCTPVSSTTSRRITHITLRGELRTASTGRQREHRALRLMNPRASLDDIKKNAEGSQSKARQSLSPQKLGNGQTVNELAVNSQAAIGNAEESEGNLGEGTHSLPAECPLNAEHFPPIGEIDHKVGRCYCHLCTCSTHICPMAFQRARLSQTLTASSYRNDYRKKDLAEPTQKYALKPLYVPNSLPIDLLTTSQRDFQPFIISSPPKAKPSTAPNQLTFNFRSSYQAEFPNWGPNHSPGEKRPRLPYRGGEVKMDLKTTYSKEFTARKRIEDPISHLNSTAGSTVFAYPLTSKIEFYSETTTAKAFQSPKRLYFAKAEKHPAEQHALSESPKKIHFQTKYQSEFKGLQQLYRPPPRTNYLA